MNINPNKNYLLKAPNEHNSSVIFNCPHSGRDYTLLSNLSILNEYDLRSSEDFFVDDFFEKVSDYGSFFLNAKFPRAFVDLNRSHKELDSRLISSLPKSSYISSKKVLSGLGVVPRVVGEGKNIYSSKIDFNEVQQRINKFYFPYHKKLKSLINLNINKFGEALIFDCHSMPHISLSNFSCDENDKPDIVLGNCFGSSCRKETFDQVKKIFNDKGFNVSVNIPFCGGFITKNYGEPKKNVNSIQIEINRKLYMNEKNQTKKSDFNRIKEKFIRISKELSEISVFSNKVDYAAE